ncbi:hypothetical protein C8Q75DRAFT_810936 [Abortiporus biennis]|nr:hypothetical protein C8Q75DRAFT_810936 [Abortiporus biennis]
MRFAFPLIAAFLAVVQVSGRALTQHLEARTFTDTCAEVDAGLSIDLLGIRITVGLIQVCLCLSGIPDFIKADAVAIAAVNLVGVASVTAEVTAMINGAKGHKNCIFPDHADPFCSASDFCGFHCKDGFELSPDKKDCICPAPKIVCNGQCEAVKACPSSHPKRELGEIQKRSAACSDGFTACGVYGWTGLRSNTAWECVDTQSDLESCGGCAIPLNARSPHGIDCTAIPGVSDVSCGAGSCRVHSCLPGYSVSMDKTYCIRKKMNHFNDDLDAAAWGLEHIPLKRED